MRRLFWLTLLLAGTWVSLRAQPSSDIARHIGWGTTLPTHCNPNTGDVFFKTTATKGMYQCPVIDTWAIIAQGGGVSGLTPGAMTKALTATSLTDAVPGVDYALPSTPGYQPNQTLSGCGVEYVTGLTFEVGACLYTITGVVYSSVLTPETLSTADPTNPRIDVIGVNTSGVVFVSTGTPAASPQQPTLDPATQLGLTFIYIPALATTPQGITVGEIYEENTEWTSAVTAHFNAASTNNPFRGTTDIEATAAVLTNSVTLTKPAAGTETLSNWNTLNFYIRSKATWPAGNGANAARILNILWLNGSTQIGVPVVLRDGAFGFSSSTTSAYQQISIPVSLFGASSAVTSLRFQVSGNGGSTSIGFYLDAVTLQGGTGGVTLPTTLMNFKGAYSTTSAYNINDVVTSAGVGYVALAANTNVAVSTSATWSPLGARNLAAVTNNFITSIVNGLPVAARPTCANLSDSGTGCSSAAPTHSFICNIGTATGSTTITTGDTGCYSDSGSFTGTINRVDVIGNASALATCSITVDIWKRNAAYPTVTQKISASAPATLSTANVSQSGSLSGWSTSVVNNDIWGASVASVTGCVYAQVRVEFQ